ncbi:hypothetical protein U9M48_042579 [Paspalum notatum var. saurae]|uniref:ATP-dependent DNA helicase n=1 Tax=Paspalum notatum var. saurae TaxID=547442 RepID=A0AAQ3UV37_PASNO
MALKDSLNKEQKAAYDKILSTVDTDSGGVFFVDGLEVPERLIRTRPCLRHYASQDKIAVATATSGVAASIMQIVNGGRTAHSRFKIPLNIDDGAVLPVVRKGTRAQIVAASLRKSYLWESMIHLKLVRNMRAQSDPWFAEYLLRIGGGTEETNSDSEIRLPDDVCVPYLAIGSDFVILMG